MSENNILADIFGEDEPKMRYILYYGLVIFMIGYHATAYFFLNAEMIKGRYDIDSYSITFTENQSTEINQAYAQDGGEPIYIEFEADDSLFVTHSGFGYLMVTVSYQETSQIPFDQCDSVSVSIPPTGATADWQNNNNTLAGSSDDCSDILLYVVVYPEYSGDERIESEGTSESNAEPWLNKNNGKGTFTIEIDVSATSPGPPPTPQDNGEEITVTWTAVFFDVTAELQ